MTDQHALDHQLDDLLDALNAGQPHATPDDPALAELLHTARRIHTLGPGVTTEPDAAFPIRLAASLERELRSDITTNNVVGGVSVLSPADRAGGDVPPSNNPPPTPLPERPRWLPEVLRLVAAVALILVLQGTGGGGDDASSGLPVPPAPCVVPINPGAQSSSGEIAYASRGTIEIAPRAGDARPIVSVAPRRASEIWVMAWSPDGRTLAYSSDGHIYLVEPGGEPRRLTHENWDSIEMSPAWSPDGRRIAFVVDVSKDDDPMTNTEIFIADITSGELTRATTTSQEELSPRWTITGQAIMYARRDDPGGRWGTWLLDADSLAQRQLFSDVAVTQDWADLSPDGCTAVWVSGDIGGDLMIAPTGDVGRTASRTLVDGSEQPVMFVSWSPAGDRILYVQVTSWHDADLRDIQLVTINPDGSGAQVVATLTSVKPMPPTWSPDGREIAFATWDFATARQMLYVMNADGSNLRVLTDALERGAVFPAWRPGTSSDVVVEPSVSPTASTLAMPDEDGIYHLTTFDQARTIVSWALVEPGATLGEYGILLDGISIDTDPVSPDRRGLIIGDVRDVVAYYQYGGDAGIEFHQQRGSCYEASVPNAEWQTVELGGKQVQATRGTNAGGLPLAIYQWDANDVCYMVFGAAPDDLALKRIQQVVEAVPLPPGGSEAVPTATVDISAFTHDRALLTVTPDFGTLDTSVVLRGRGFMPETSVAILGGPLTGESASPPVVAVTVTADGTFSVTLDPATIAEVCGGLVRGQTCRLTATQGSMTQLTDPVGPSAVAVFTYSEDTPLGVRDRSFLPSCGVDLALDGASWDAEAGAAARQCLIDAAEGGRAAELAYYQQATNGDILATIYRLYGDGTAVIFSGSLLSGSGGEGWTVSSCTDAKMVMEESGAIMFEHCREPTRFP